MKKLLVLVVVLILVGAALWAQNNIGTGQWLHDLWTDEQKAEIGIITWEGVDRIPGKIELVRDADIAANANMYRGFVLGAGMVMEGQGWLSLEHVSFGQIVKVVGKYLDDHPEQWNLGAIISVYRALYAAWPGKVAAPYR